MSSRDRKRAPALRRSYEERRDEKRAAALTPRLPWLVPTIAIVAGVIVVAGIIASVVVGRFF